MATTAVANIEDLIVAKRLVQEQIRKARVNLAAFIEFCAKDEDGGPVELHYLHRAWIVHVNHAWNRGKHAMIMAPFSSGKCQPAHSKVQLSDGTTAAIGNLCGLMVSVVAYDAETGRFAPAWARVFGNGDRRVIRIGLRSGREIDVTEEHPFLTVNGWVKAADLAIGRSVAVANNLPNMGTHRLRDGEPELFGFIVGDGSVKQTGIEVANGDPHLLDAIAAAAERAGFRSTRFNYPPRTPGVRVLGGCRSWFMEQQAHEHCTAWTKVTPPKIFSAPVDQIARYIGAYVACDGHVDAKGNVELYSVNRGLLDDVQSLLLRLGIVSVVFPKNGKYLGRHHASWRLRVRRPWLDLFRERVPVPGEKGQKLATFGPRTTGRLTNNDIIPLGYRKYLKRTAHWHKVNTGVSLDQAKTKNHRQMGTARGVVRLAAEAEGNAYLLKLTAPEIFWDEIVTIRDMGVQPTFGMEVDGHHTYLTSDVIVHNTGFLVPLAAYLVGRNPQVRIKVVCANDDMAKLRVASIKSLIESYEYRRVFPHIRRGQKWDTQDAFVERQGHGTDPTIQARGVLTEGIGSKADYLFMDDVCTQKNSEEAAVRAKIKKMATGTWMSRLDGPEARALAFATAWSSDDYSNDIKNDRRWLTLIQRIQMPSLDFYDQEVFGTELEDYPVGSPV